MQANVRIRDVLKRKRDARNDGDNDRRYALVTVDEKLEDLSSSEKSKFLSDDLWIVDSGASRHLVSDESLLEDAKLCSEKENLILPDGGVLRVTKVGSVTLKNTSGIRSTIVLTEVYYAPNLARNLISLGCLREKGCILKDNGKLWK